MGCGDIGRWSTFIVEMVTCSSSSIYAYSLSPVFPLQSSDLGGRLSGLLERYQQYQDEAVSLHTWLSAQEQNRSIAGPSGETDTQTLQNTLRAVQVRA